MYLYAERYEPIIGLEVHAQLLTISKAFCGCSTKFSSLPNTNTCPICLGHPGTLPAVNRNLIDFVLMLGLSANCEIQPISIFARKNYFYPDLPKNYQITQYASPICTNGYIVIELDNFTTKKIGITRIHMEEDAGRLIHNPGNYSLVDFNRCGIPLVEIVSEPDMRSPNEAYIYLTQLKKILTYLGICDGKMEEGSLRCDANISVRAKGSQEFYAKTEVKNLNSFRNVEKALEFEINRQIGILHSGKKVLQETLLWDDDRNIAIAMRAKEEAHDYRYFPEPDLVPVVIDTQWNESVRAKLPELPLERRDRFQTQYELPRYDADLLTSEKPLADFYERVVISFDKDSPALFKAASNWMMTDVMRILKERNSDNPELVIQAEYLADLIRLIANGTISGKIAKKVFAEIVQSGNPPAVIIEEKSLKQVTDEKVIESIIEKILAENQDQVVYYLRGKERMFAYFVGKVMKATEGKVNPSVVNTILRKKLEELRKENRNMTK